MTNNKVADFLKETGASLSGHFQLTSGLHSDKYVQCAQLLQHPEYAEAVGKELALKFADARGQKLCVIGLAMGGIVVGHELARALDARSIFAERKDGKMQIRRGFRIAPDEKVILAEDVVTTGGSVLEVVELLKVMGKEVLGIGSVIFRGGENHPFDCRYEHLVTVNAVTYKPEKCPLCQQGVPIDKPGSRES